MSRQIYRQEAMERLSSPEQLDQLMPVTSSRGWIALLGVGLLLLMGMAWSILGTVTTTVEGNGMLMRYGGLEWAESPLAGTVTAIVVSEGDVVKAGDVVAMVSYVDDRGEPVVGKVLSPRDGRVLNVATVNGAVVAKGAVLVSIESPDHPLQAVIYFAASDGYKVAPGMSVKILPATEVEQGAVYLSGQVKRASRFPASRGAMMYSLQHEDWVNSFLTLGPVLEVVIDVTSKKTAHLYSGTPCKSSVIIQARRPIEFLVPGFGDR